MRNMNDTVAKFDPSTIPGPYSMKASEAAQLIDEVTRSPLKAYSVIRKAFYYGFILGQRAEKAKQK